MSEARAEIHLLPDPAGGPAGADGPVRSVQAAELDVPREFLERSWNASHLERLARGYWAYLRRISLRLLRVSYGPSSRVVELRPARIPLLRFREPRYETGPDFGQVTWPIERGVLVARAGRGRGYLRITVRRLRTPGSKPGTERLHVIAEVANFYPLLRLTGRLANVGAWLYNQTQLRIHVLVTRGFLRSLASLELPPARVAPAPGPD